MAYTVTELITRAWYLSSIVARDFETVSGDQLHDGLQMLNSLLSFKAVDTRRIPYYKQYLFNAVVGQEEYFIPGLIEVETLTFNLQTVRYSMTQVGRSEYFSTPRANDIKSLPYQYHIEREKDGARLFMYFLPQETYPFKLRGKLFLSNVSLNQDLSLTLDLFYIEYLRYALAEYMCQEYGVTYQPESQQKLKEFESMIFDISPIDFTQSKSSCFGTNSGYDYAQINLGKGFVPTQ